MTKVFRQHIEEVKKTVPADRLLVYDVKEGWEPLCRFLGVPIPEGVPFPHKNDRRFFKRMIFWLGILEWGVPAGIVLMIIILIIWFVKG